MRWKLVLFPELMLSRSLLDNRIVLYGAAIFMVAIVGVADYTSGWELSFSIFYLLPVGVVALKGSSRGGIAISVLSALTWLGVDFSTRPYGHWAIAVWNAGVRLAFFVIATVMLSRLREIADRERQLATTDYLTGVANSRSLYLALEHEIERARRSERPFTLALLDLDNFKAVNDGSGHLVGDRVLRVVAESLAASLRSVDLVSRLGGDEFAILLPETALDDARRTLARVHSALTDAMQAHGWPVTFSVGAVTASAPQGPIERIVGVADDLMYRAKNEGKDRLFMAEYTDPR